MRWLWRIAVATACLSCRGDSDGPAADETSTGVATQGPSDGTTAGSSDGDSSGAADPLVADPGASRYALVGERVILDGSASTGAELYQWNADDGSPAPAPGAEPTLAVTYAEPGRYHPVLTVTDADANTQSASVTITVTHVPSHEPRQSSTIAPAPGGGVAVVSPDSDELVVIDPDFEVAARLPTAGHPRTVAYWNARPVVACQADDLVQLLDPPETVQLPRGSRPYGVAVLGDRIYVSLQATGRLAEIDATALSVVAEHDALPDARGVAVLPDGRIAVSRWRSLDAEGQIALVDGAAVELVALAFDPKEASDTEAGGVPTYLSQILVSPIGDLVALPSLQANIADGAFVSGDPLTFETTVRGVVSYLELPGPTENFDRRKHFDNRGFMSAGVFSSRGDYLFLAARGSRAVERVDTFNGGQAGTLLDVGMAPDGLALSPDDRYLYVDAFMSREVVVYDFADGALPTEPVARVSILDAEPLSAELLLGKQLFNDSFDPRIAKDSYIACAHCHLDGEADRRTWDFTDRGEGLRNTISLLGRGGTAHGPIHWSANFDEVQDFEHDIRGPFGGSGLMSDAEFNTGTRNQTLGDPKAGVSSDLDALAAYVDSLAAFVRSPFRAPDGAMLPDAVAGETVFANAGCPACHLGSRLTDSMFDGGGDPLLHDVGTLSAASGQRLGGPLLGIDTPTLHGLWNAPPYLHDGSAATIRDVLTTANPADAHGTTSGLTAAEIDQLVAYLRSLEG